jgi:hypothetical protein
MTLGGRSDSLFELPQVVPIMNNAIGHQQLIHDFRIQVDELQRQFELYFQGLERRPPVDERESLKRALLKQKGEASRWNTADRFRMNTLMQKFTSYDRMWERTLQEIENGTYRRDLNRVKRKNASDAQATKKPSSASAALDKNTKGPVLGADGVNNAKLEKLYRVYVDAKRRTGERTNLTMDSLKKQLDKQIPALKAKHRCKEVDFKVVLKNGKAMLKPVPK